MNRLALLMLALLVGCAPGNNVRPLPPTPPSKCQVVRSDGTHYDCPPWIFGPSQPVWRGPVIPR